MKGYFHEPSSISHRSRFPDTIFFQFLRSISSISFDIRYFYKVSFFFFLFNQKIFTTFAVRHWQQVVLTTVSCYLFNRKIMETIDGAT